MLTEHGKAWRNERAKQLLDMMVQGAIPEIKPRLNLQSEMGFSFPQVNQILNTTDQESLALLESLADEGILVRRFSDKYLRCPRCQSMNLSPVYYCTKCGSGNIKRGAMLEHLLCKYVDTEDAFLSSGKLVCPNCKQGLKTPDADYRSLGVLHKCNDCQELSAQPSITWRCLKCASITSIDKIMEVTAYSYTLNEEKRSWLGFELKPKLQLMQFLRERGYEVKENARAQGKSGAEHTFDMLASRDAGVLIHQIAVGAEIAEDMIGLDKIFDFDEKAYDCGINHKIFIAIPEATAEAARFAARQKIRMLESNDLGKFLASGVLPPLGEEPGAEMEPSPFEFKSKSSLIEYLQSRGYEVKQDAQMKGRSETEHTFDLLAIKDDGIAIHNIAIGIGVAEDLLGMEKIFNFDDKAYDCGISDKVFIAVPGLTEEAGRLAQRQRIRVFEANALESDD